MVDVSGVLYVVATPIGHLGDISHRALNILSTVDLIATEDTRHTSKLLRAYSIHTPMVAYHEHNEIQEAPRLAALIASGQKLALVSDAGTPLISDPGFRLVSEARRLKLPVVPIPGPSALICALSAAGLPSDRFLFLGFPPRGTEQRRELFQSLLHEPGTIILYEAGPRLHVTLIDLEFVLGAERRIVLARELTKRYETFVDGNLGTIATSIAADPMQLKGEHVLLIAGARQHPAMTQDIAEAERILRVLLEDLPLKQAVKLASQISPSNRNDLYRLALTIKQRNHLSQLTTHDCGQDGSK